MIIREAREIAVNYYSYFSHFFGEGASKRATDTRHKIKFAILFAAEQQVKQLEKKLFDANIFYLSFLFWTFP